MKMKWKRPCREIFQDPSKLYIFLLLEGTNAAKRGDHQKKFFINNAVEALIPFKEEDRQGFLRLHVPFGG